MKYIYLLLGIGLVAGCATNSNTKTPTVSNQQVFIDRCREVLGRQSNCSIHSTQILNAGTTRTLSFGKEAGRDSLWVCSKNSPSDKDADMTMPSIEFDGEWPKGRPAALGEFKCAYLVCNEELCQESGDETALKVLRQNAKALDVISPLGEVTRADLYDCLNGKAEPLTTMACAGIANLPKDKVIHYFTKKELAQAKAVFEKNSEKLNKEVVKQCQSAGARIKSLKPQALPEKPLQLQLESIRCEGGELFGEAAMLSEQLAQKKASSILLVNAKEKIFRQAQELPFPLDPKGTQVFQDSYKIEKRVNGFYFMTALADEWATSAYNLPLCVGYQSKGDEVILSRIGQGAALDCSKGGASIWKYKVVKESAK